LLILLEFLEFYKISLYFICTGTTRLVAIMMQYSYYITYLVYFFTNNEYYQAVFEIFGIELIIFENECYLKTKFRF